MGLFSAADERRLSQVIGELESQTAGELVVTSTARSDAYAHHRAFLVGIWVVVLAMVLHFYVPALDTFYVLALQWPLALLLWWVSKTSWVARRMLPAALMQQKVYERAKQVFFERGLHATRDRSGLMIFISELEHRVVIWGDVGIDARVQKEGWERHVSHIVTGIKQGRASQAVEEVLRELGVVLARDFPPRPDDVNELPDEVVRHAH